MTPSQRAALEQKRGVSATSKPRCDAYGTSRDISRETIEHIRNAESSLGRVATLCDIAETRAGRSRVPTFIPPRDSQRIADEVSLALETIALTGRRV